MEPLHDAHDRRRVFLHRDHALRVRFADRDVQSGGSIGVAIQAVQRQSLDLVTPGSSPARDEDRGTLERILEAFNGLHQASQFVVGNKPWHSLRPLWKIAVDQQRMCWYLVPTPVRHLTKEGR